MTRLPALALLASLALYAGLVALADDAPRASCVPSLVGVGR